MVSMKLCRAGFWTNLISLWAGPSHSLEEMFIHFGLLRQIIWLTWIRAFIAWCHFTFRSMWCNGYCSLQYFWQSNNSWICIKDQDSSTFNQDRCLIYFGFFFDVDTLCCWCLGVCDQLMWAQRNPARFQPTQTPYLAHHKRRKYVYVLQVASVSHFIFTYSESFEFSLSPLSFGTHLPSSYLSSAWGVFFSLVLASKSAGFITYRWISVGRWRFVSCKW